MVMGNRRLIRATEFWKTKDGLVFIENNSLHLILNKTQSTIWQLLDGGLTSQEIIEKADDLNIPAEYVKGFIDYCLKLGILNYAGDEWDI
ncbi:hypothetical protein CCDG5_1907 [[Clostridium] cellulosi]|uniref:Coenzyme PQQ synthesis protein D (PqqD) n=1 Tax=[Clostridium] cellulosi TaxID=29343 RepID=A0A078KR70_9FIRM|nr:hypothetical protein CCDG5_1907 [[Clostridium] cellulosi]